MLNLINKVYAAEYEDLGPGPTNESFSALKNVEVQSLISEAIKGIMIITTVVFFFIFVFGGIKWITSGGDEKKVAAARSSITHALIGLAIVFSAWAIMALINSIFKVDILQNFSLPSAVN